jgi:hypothetical protein
MYGEQEIDMRTILLLIFAIALSACANLEPLVVYSHVSDPTTSSDVTTDFLGAGATYTTPSDKLEVDMALGRRALDCHVSKGCPSTWGGMLEVKWRPGRKGLR